MTQNQARKAVDYNVPKDYYYQFFDQLPKVLRDKINYAEYMVNSETVFNIWKLNGVKAASQSIDIMVATIKRKEEYQQKVESGEIKPKISRIK